MEQKPANVLMERNGKQAEVANNASVQIMAGLGWKVVEAKANKKPSDGLRVDELKAALAEKGIGIADGAKKEDLAALLDAAD